MPRKSSSPLDVLDRELNALRRVKPDDLRARLRHIARKLGALANSGQLDRSHMERHLISAAEACGLDRAEAVDIVRAGGLLTPAEDRDAAGITDLLADADDPRAVIRLRAGRLDEAVEALDSAFDVAAGPPAVLQRSGELVHITRQPVRRDDGKTETQEAIAPISPAALRAAACKVARFERLDSRASGGGEWVPKDPPRPVIDAFVSAPNWMGVRDLVQLIGAPLLRRDGSLLAAPGYDPKTGYYLTRPVAVEVPERPTAAAAARANDLLTSFFTSYPYLDPQHAPGLGLSVSLAALFTAILRPTLGPAPIFAFDSPVPGAGKSTRANEISVAATGERAEAVATGSKPEEFEKALGAALITGRPLLSLDNLVVPLGGQLLAMVVSERAVRIRILGLSKDIKLPSAPTILATGNNIRIAGDLARRTIIARLDPKMERPEERSFESDPIAEALARRPEIVSAVLTIVRWHLTRRDPAPPLARSFAGYDGWTERVRAPLVALGHADPVAGADVARASDEDVEQLRGLMHLWHEVIRDEPVTANQVVQRAFLADERGRRHPELAAAIAGVTRGGEGKPGDVRRVGKYLARHADRIISGRCFRRAGSHERAIKWRLETVSE